MNKSRLAKRLQQQIEYFSGKLCGGMSKPVGRSVCEMIYGIQARQSVRLSEVARSLNEEIRLIKTENRLSRQLGRSGLKDALCKSLIEEGKGKIGKETLLIVDISDIAKKYAEKMEYMARVRDGSDGVISDGYWLCDIIGVERGGKEIVPLYQELYSQDAPGFASENKEIEKGIVKVTKAIGGKGVWVIDRGGDRRKIYDFLLDNELRFLVRLVGNRHLFYRGRKVLASELVHRCKYRYAERIVKENSNTEKAYTIEYGFVKVKLPKSEEKLYMVIVKGFGEEPMLLLTNVGLKKSRKSLWQIVESYITRWTIEETIRYMKQSYGLEDVRVLRYGSLRNLMVIVMATMYFACVYLGQRPKLQILAMYVLRSAKRLFGIPDFRYYALADGIRSILYPYAGRKTRPFTYKSPRYQLSLF